jgi:hypothetical protein
MDSACLARARHAEGACLALPRRRASARARRSRSSLPAEWARLRSVPQRAAAAADGRRQRLQPLHVRGRLQRRQVRLRIRAKRRLAAPGRPDRAPLRGPWGSAPRSPRRLSGAPPPAGALDARLLAAKGPLPPFSQESAQTCLDSGSACKHRKKRVPGTVTSSSSRLLAATAATDWADIPGTLPCACTLARPLASTAGARPAGRVVRRSQPGRHLGGRRLVHRGGQALPGAGAVAALGQRAVLRKDLRRGHGVCACGFAGSADTRLPRRAELGGPKTGSLHVVSCQAGEPRAGAIGRRRQACRPTGTGALVTASLSRAGGRHTLDACNAYAPQRPFPAGAPRRRASLRGAGPGSLATQARRAGPEAPAARPAS